MPGPLIWCCSSSRTLHARSTISAIFISSSDTSSEAPFFATVSFPEPSVFVETAADESGRDSPSRFGVGAGGAAAPSLGFSTASDGPSSDLAPASTADGFSPAAFWKRATAAAELTPMRWENHVGRLSPRGSPTCRFRPANREDFPRYCTSGRFEASATSSSSSSSDSSTSGGKKMNTSCLILVGSSIRPRSPLMRTSGTPPSDQPCDRSRRYRHNSDRAIALFPSTTAVLSRSANASPSASANGDRDRAGRPLLPVCKTPFGKSTHNSGSAVAFTSFSITRENSLIIIPNRGSVPIDPGSSNSSLTDAWHDVITSRSSLSG